MPWYAVDAVSDALDESTSLLFPFDLKRWLALAVMTFFVGGTGNVPSFNYQFDAPLDSPPMRTMPDVSTLWTLLVVGLVAVMLLAVVFTLIGSIVEFVFVDALRTHDVRFRGRFGARTGAGLRLFGFRLVLLLGALVVASMVVGPILAALVLGLPLALVSLVVLVPLAIVLGIGLAAVEDFTTSFVVALVCERGGGIIEGWRVLWPTVRAEWQQFALYAVLKLGLVMVIGLVVGVGLALVFFPIGVLVGAGLLAGVVSPALIAVGVAFALALFVLVHIFVQMPVSVYLRYYSLLVLDAADVEWTIRPPA